MQSIKDAITSVVERHVIALATHAGSLLPVQAAVDEVVTDLEAREQYQARSIFESGRQRGLRADEIHAALERAGLPLPTDGPVHPDEPPAPIPATNPGVTRPFTNEELADLPVGTVIESIIAKTQRTKGKGGRWHWGISDSVGRAHLKAPQMLVSLPVEAEGVTEPNSDVREAFIDLVDALLVFGRALGVTDLTVR